MTSRLLAQEATKEEKFVQQDQQYVFPYHWIPRVDVSGAISLGRSLSWGLDYLSYMSFVASEVMAARPDSLLDVGCGDGRFHEFVKRSPNGGQVRYTGVDLSERAIQLARIMTDGADFRLGPVAQVREEFSAAVMIEVLEHVREEEVADVLSAVRARLGRDGKLWVSVPSDNQRVSKKHYRHYNRESLERHLLSGGFRVERVWFISRDSWLTRRIRRLVANDFYTLNPSFLTRWLWRLQWRLGIPATSTTCRHLVARACRAQLEPTRE